jgi:hypothetical protein
MCISILTFGQPSENQKMIQLGKTYKDFMFRNEPTKQILKEIKSDVPESLKTTTDFIIQAITTKNKLLSQQYLSRPDDITLKQIYIIRAINLNLRKENSIDNNILIDSLSKKEIPTYELVDNYYGMVFTSIGNKNQPFNLSKTHFKMNEYNFKDDTEKGIMFLRCMDYCGKTIWGFMNVVKPANTSKAYANIKKFPDFNGQPYYQYNDFYFPDFEMKIIQDEDIQSYKTYYINKFYEILLSHLICINKEGGTQEEKNDLLLGSILKENNLYKYTQYKETLESIFKEQEME